MHVELIMAIIIIVDVVVAATAVLRGPPLRAVRKGFSVKAAST